MGEVAYTEGEHKDLQYLAGLALVKVGLGSLILAIVAP